MNLKNIHRMFRHKLFSKDDNASQTIKSVHLVGSNWLDNPQLPIAVLYGFNPWKREVVSEYLKEYRTAFIRGKASFLKVKSGLLNTLEKEGEEYCIIGWGNKLPKSYKKYAEYKNKKGANIRVGCIEDGFIRSIGAGLLHTRPSSLCLDWSGIYFDSKKESDLEKIIKNYDFEADNELLVRARNAIVLIKSARLTKYYNPRPFTNCLGKEKSDNYSILVIGQVEDDASVLSSQSKVRDNLSLVLEAKSDYPNAEIYFRPHPDYWSGIRKPKTKLSDISKHCVIIPPSTSLYDMFEVVDHVFTISSLSGFEALIHGLEVTCVGAPFYSNWGLTNDKVVLERRKGINVSLEQLVAATYFLYPRYMSMHSNDLISFEDVADEFVIETLKHAKYLDLSEDKIYCNLVETSSLSTLSFLILKHLVESGNFAEADIKKLDEIIESKDENDFLRSFSNICQLLANSSNYDALANCINRLIEILEVRSNSVLKDEKLAQSIMYSLSIHLHQLNGRVVNNIPLIDFSLSKMKWEKNLFSSIISDYCKVLASSLQYNDLEEVVNRIGLEAKVDLDGSAVVNDGSLSKYIDNEFKNKSYIGPDIFKKIALSLSQKPYRSERHHAYRHAILERLSKKHLLELNRKYPKTADTFFNHAIKSMLVDDANKCEFYFNQYFDLGFNKYKEGDKISRHSEFLSLVSYLIKKRKPDVYSKIVNVKGSINKEQFNLLTLNYFRTIQNGDKFYEYHSSLDEEVKENDKVIAVFARQLRDDGLLTSARYQFQKLLERPASMQKRISLEGELEKLDFLIRTSEILNFYPQPKLPKGVVLLASQTCFNTLAMMAPVLVELKKQGYAVVNICSGMTEHQSTGIDYIDEFAGSLPIDLVFNEMQNDWLVNWQAKIVESDGVNYYQGFYERLSTSSRRFFVDVNQTFINRDLNLNLKRADACLHICKQAYNKLVKRGIPVAFVSGNSHVTPFSVFRDYARSKNDPKITFINCNVAYEAYFSNLGSKFANTMCVSDMTLYPNIRAPFMARRDKFERWYEKNKNNKAYVDQAMELINVNRVGSTTNTKESEVIDTINKAKSENKKIVCAFGKVPVDLNVPYDGGPAHDNMSDWITHTVDLVRGRDDLVLLVKPHPHELRPEIALDLVESFADLIKTKIPDNVIILGHKDINGHVLAPYLDLALLYNGSSALELTAQGVPVILTSHFGKHDYPIDLNYPKSRKNYETMMMLGEDLKPTGEIRKKAAFLICYLGTDEISTLNQYSLRQLTNDKIGLPKWREDLISDFLRNGDEKMSNIASQIVEKFERTI